jgi:hypothetical protein
VAIGLLEHARDAGAPPDPAERVELFGRLFDLYRRSGDVARALALLQDCLLQLRRSPVVDATKVVRYAVWLSRAYTEPATARAADALGSPSPTAAIRPTCSRARGAVRARGWRPPATGALRSADRSLSLYELDEDNRALSEAHPAYAAAARRWRAEAGRHLIAARNPLGAHPSATDHGRIPVEDARQALLVGDAAAALASRSRPRLAEGDGPASAGAAASRTSWAGRAGGRRSSPPSSDPGPRASARDLARAYSPRQVPEAGRSRRGGLRGVPSSPPTSRRRTRMRWRRPGAQHTAPTRRPAGIRIAV